MRKFYVGAIALATMSSVALANDGAVPMLLAHQGQLYGADGYPTDREVVITYSLFTSATGGNAIWSEEENAKVDDGYFSSVLGDGTKLTPALFSNARVYLGVNIDGEDLMPRTEIVSVPYAIISSDAIGDIHPTSITVGGKTIVDANGKWTGDSSGLVGATGPAGAIGPMGPDGAMGTQGPAGGAGSAGPAGADGAVGPQGPAGADGAVGAMGPQGARGLACWDANENGECNLDTEDLDNSQSCTVADCVGPRGQTGERGEVGPAGERGLQGEQGLQGLVGPQGEIGPQGHVGPEGPAGKRGEPGLTGERGLQGEQGLFGPQGEIGPQGLQGLVGPQGDVGQQGLVGPEGPAGKRGEPGIVGERGERGEKGDAGGGSSFNLDAGIPAIQVGHQTSTNPALYTGFANGGNNSSGVNAIYAMRAPNWCYATARIDSTAPGAMTFTVKEVTIAATPGNVMVDSGAIQSCSTSGDSPSCTMYFTLRPGQMFALHVVQSGANYAWFSSFKCESSAD